jgi:hypothetical protein
MPGRSEELMQSSEEMRSLWREEVLPDQPEVSRPLGTAAELGLLDPSADEGFVE